jgi:sugar (pentulose or hexulose) kinase
LRIGEGFLALGSTIVADIGKSFSKLSLWSRDGQMLERHERANAPCVSRHHACLDVEGIADWLVQTLALFARHPIEAIIPVAHGAAVAALKDGALLCPVPDYEHPLPSALLADYRQQRDPFSQTGSPALPSGLNMGAQLHWLEQLHPDEIPRAMLLPYAQYWAWFLSGEARSEVTSLGCHSDLWLPLQRDFSPLAKRRGWAQRFAPLATAGDGIGTLRPELAARTGLSTDVRIHAGLHDSNAALLAARGFDQIADHDATVLSTGTWFVAMRSAAQDFDAATLPEARDCLLNVDAAGKPVPSARFMGGREIELLVGVDGGRIDREADQPMLLEALAPLLARGIMLLPSFATGFGPYPSVEGHWIKEPQEEILRRAAVCLYAALVADASLAMIGCNARLLVEGRFAGAALFVRALASLRPDVAVYTAAGDADVSFGALRLLEPGLRPRASLQRVAPLDISLLDYRTTWQTHINQSRA